ncbi:MAG: phosphatase PAP2 family protein [Pirellulaceae bacterium]|nr:phosphatase PAP2 family protein [Pirellulaceae bacterium]
MYDSLNPVNIDVYMTMQELVGRSWLLDSLLTMATDNQLVKAVVVGCSFVAAWYAASDEQSFRVRRILTVTVLAGLFAIAASKMIASNVLSPRPVLFSSPVYVSQGEQVKKAEQLLIREPLDSDGLENMRAFQAGDFGDSDLESFPSDHAALFVSLSVGILYAHRSLGVLALSWTVLVILIPRVVTGMHWPLDVVAGGLIGGLSTVAAVWMTTQRRIPILDPLIRWSMGKPAFSAALLFAVVFEACNSYYNFRLILRMMKDAARLFLDP